MHPIKCLASKHKGEKKEELIAARRDMRRKRAKKEIRTSELPWHITKVALLERKL